MTEEYNEKLLLCHFYTNTNIPWQLETRREIGGTHCWLFVTQDGFAGEAGRSWMGSAPSKAGELLDCVDLYTDRARGAS